MRRFLGVLALSSLLACGDPAPPMLDELPARYAEAFCEASERCLGPLFAALEEAGDCATELAKEIEEGTLPLWEASIESGAVVYRGSEVEPCLTQLSGAGCELFANSVPVRCDAVFEGQVAAGGGCIANEDCADGFCAIAAACPGTCVARSAAGAGCEDDDQCQRGLQCLGGTCGVAPGEGEDCETECAVPLQCLDGTCQSLDTALDGAVDDPCDPEAFDLCDSGVSCALLGAGAGGLEWTCRAPVGMGETCQLAFPEMCPSGQFCDADPEGTGSFDGTCVPLPGQGEPCRDSELGAECGPGLLCDGELCQRVQHAGSACANDAFCYSGHCVDGTCALAMCEE